MKIKMDSASFYYIMSRIFTEEQVELFTKVIGPAGGNGYRDFALNSKAWEDLYLFDWNFCASRRFHTPDEMNFVRKIQFTDHHTVQEKASACYGCGIILPIRCLHIDHVVPKTGDQYLFFQKMLKFLNGKSKGFFSQAFFYNIDHEPICESYFEPPKRIFEREIRAPEPFNEERTTNAANSTLDYLAQRFTGNGIDDGHVWDFINDFAIYTKNSLINLRPMCAECNTSKGGVRKPK